MPVSAHVVQVLRQDDLRPRLGDAIVQRFDSTHTQSYGAHIESFSIDRDSSHDCLAPQVAALVASEATLAEAFVIWDWQKTVMTTSLDAVLKGQGELS
jgi:hypothetical protein